jgi:DNA modification methylase
MNWKDKTIFIGDNLHVMRGMNSDSVDLIYLDPPFNSNRNYAALIGSQAAGAAFKDTWTLSDVDIPEHGRAKVIADREDIKASYVTVLRWIRDWRHKG